MTTNTGSHTNKHENEVTAEYIHTNINIIDPAGYRRHPHNDSPSNDSPSNVNENQDETYSS